MVQLVEWLLLTPEDPCSNQAIGNFNYEDWLTVTFKRKAKDEYKNNWPGAVLYLTLALGAFL